jgi:2-polyprenyl-3-methyl-5-hydroxy-6-metoxy-1,4-benzoquinol methylase
MLKNCLLCDSTKLEPAFHKKGFAFFRCRACGTLQVDLHISDEEVFAHYSEAYYEADAAGTEEDRGGYPSYRGAQDTLTASFSNKVDIVRRFAPGGRLLDAGAAYGLFLKAASQYFEGSGLDVSSYAAQVAREEFGMDVNAGNIEKTGFPDAHFDVVVLWDIIEHLIRPVDAMREVARILKPGGHVFISTDDAANWLPRMLGSNWWAIAPPMHLCHFSKKGMNAAMQRAGLGLKAFTADPRRYSIAEIIKHFGVSYQSGFLTSFGTWMEKNSVGKFVFRVKRPEQFVAVGQKPASLP